ncbi:hypothetical protein AYI68_g3412 [Smittium mucronatum]|uniref:Uncharacterized protein n=1 Tax=Smittium mucronatum TaxID=133383 RepID=A0A1R0H005_9FUNG|nr:hypothetical protein AYI68_g3412 [Smittium mucronatum]
MSIIRSVSVFFAVAQACLLTPIQLQKRVDAYVDSTTTSNTKRKFAKKTNYTSSSISPAFIYASSTSSSNTLFLLSSLLPSSSSGAYYPSTISSAVSSSSDVYVVPTTSSAISLSHLHLMYYIIGYVSLTSSEIYVSTETEAPQVYITPETSTSESYVALEVTPKPIVALETSTYEPVVPATSSVPAASSDTSYQNKDLFPASNQSSSSISPQLSGQATYYDVGLGSCGITNDDSQMVAAINKDQYVAFSNLKVAEFCRLQAQIIYSS